MKDMRFLFVGIFLFACSGVVHAQKALKFDAPAVEREIRQFYEAYATELREHKGMAIAERYDSRGAYALGNGRKVFQPFAEIKSKYEKWTGPKSFSWKNLSIDVISPDVAAVLGQFEWGTASGPVVTYSYTGLLVRRDGKWRIRVEDESRGVNPPSQ